MHDTTAAPAGFTQTDNLNDVLMIKCPIAAPEGQDEILQARLEVLRARGLTPQLFLPAKNLDVRASHSKNDRWLLCTSHSSTVASASV